MWFSVMHEARFRAASNLIATCATGICRFTIDVTLCTSDGSRRVGDMAEFLYLPLSMFCLSISGIGALCDRFRTDIRLSFNGPPLAGDSCWWWCWGWWWWWWWCRLASCWFCADCWPLERTPGDNDDDDDELNNSNLAFITILFNFIACCGCAIMACSMMMAFFGWRILENGRELNSCSVAVAAGLRGRIGGDRSIPFDLMNGLRDVEPAKLFRRLAALNLVSDSVNWCKFCVYVKNDQN